MSPHIPSQRSYSILHHLIPYSHSCSSWEFVVTLDYEWSVIRGRRPHMWTTWVCTAPPWVTLHGALVLISSFRVALFPDTLVHPRFRNSQHARIRYFQPDQLSSVYHIPWCIPYSGLTDRMLAKVWVICLAVSHLFPRKDDR